MFGSRWRCAAGVSLALAASSALTGGCDNPESSASPAAPAVSTLTIVTPHNEAIRSAFSDGFARWYAQQRGRRVALDWVVRGTPQCVEYVDRAFQSAPEEFRADIPDLMFGGGIGDHRLLADRGYSRKVDLGKALEGIPAEVAGLPTRDPQGRWYGTGLSSFGILYNARACRERGIQPPATWSDLADPRFAGWIGVADPAASGSHRECMLIMLQHLGWERGWPTLMQILANASALNRRSADAISGVQAGVFLAAFAVNFDGMRAAAESGGDLVYVNPAGATAVSPDVVSLLNSPRPDEAARDFVRFLLSEEGQLLWAGKAADGRGGGAVLYHYPIVTQIYEQHAAGLCVTENPLAADFGVTFDLNRAERLGPALQLLVKAAAGPNHIRLQRAWARVRAAGAPPDAVAALFAPPLVENAAAELAERLNGADAATGQAMFDEWSARFQQRYDAVLSPGGA